MDDASPRVSIDATAVEFFDEGCTEATAGRLNAVLRTDAEARAAFLAVARISVLLDETVSSVPAAFIVEQQEALAERSEATPPDEAVGRVRFRRAAVAMAAAVVLAGAAMAIVWSLAGDDPAPPPIDPSPIATNPTPVATLVDVSPGATVMVGREIGNPGHDYAAQPIQIDEGVAEFQLTSGANIRLSGKTRMTLRSAMSARLTLGEATIKCPPSAVGYRVDLPNGAWVVDQGTIFRVRVEDDRRSRVWLISGALDVGLGGQQISLREPGVVAITDGRVRRLPEEPVLVAHYPFDGSADDAVGEAHGELAEDANFIRGVIGRAVRLDSVGAPKPNPNPRLHARVDDSVAFAPGTDHFSVSFFAVRTVITKKPCTIFRFENEAADTFSLEFDAMRTLRMRIGKTGEAAFEIARDDARTLARREARLWGYRHYAMVVRREADRARVELYIDGKKADAADMDLPADHSVSAVGDLFIGAAGPDVRTRMNGYLDDLRFYRGMLSPEGIRELAKPIIDADAEIAPEEGVGSSR